MLQFRHVAKSKNLPTCLQLLKECFIEKTSNPLCPYSIGFESPLLKFPYFPKICHPILLIIHYSACQEVVKWSCPNLLSLAKLKDTYNRKIREISFKNANAKTFGRMLLRMKSNPLCLYSVGFESSLLKFH